MTEEKICGLLDIAYEIEGLLQLSLSRDDCPEAIPSLIRRKAESFLELLEERPVAVSATEKDDEPFGGIYEYVEEDTDAVVEAAPATAPGDMPERAPEVMEEHVDVAAPEVVKEVVKEEIAAAEAEEAVVIPEPKCTAPVDVRTGAQTKNRSREVATGRLVFSINDRYRYRRELFGGDDRAFTDALARVASMEGYEEAEEYFIDECEWDVERPEVVDFMAALRTYFES